MTDLPKEAPAQEMLDYETALCKVAEEMQRLLRSAPSVIRHLTRHLSKATGKMVRARALLACAIRDDGSISPDAVRAAAAVELMHLATLVHDDIIDDADKRRGIETLHRKFGGKHAVLCGDFLLCTALEFVASIASPAHRPDNLARAIPSYLTEVCLGELRQNQNNHNFKLSEREYFKIIRGKTAALFEACFYAGFILSDAPESAKDAYTQIGDDLGIIFQLSDDCADYAASRKVTKKPVLSDYSRGVITLPLIHAMKKDNELLRRAQEGMKPADLKIAVEAAGGLTYTRRKIDKLYRRADALLGTMALSAFQKELLTTLLRRAAGYSDVAVQA